MYAPDTRVILSSKGGNRNCGKNKKEGGTQKRT